MRYPLIQLAILAFAICAWHQVYEPLFGTVLNHWFVLAAPVPLGESKRQPCADQAHKGSGNSKFLNTGHKNSPKFLDAGLRTASFVQSLKVSNDGDAKVEIGSPCVEFECRARWLQYLDRTISIVTGGVPRPTSCTVFGYCD